MILFIKCFFVGMLAIFPGISGSALAISLNIYEKIFYSLKNIRYNLEFIIVASVGIILGIIIGSKIIIYFYEYKNILYYIFIGLIIGDIPLMVNKIKNNGKIRYSLIILSFILSLITFLFCKNIFGKKNSFFKMVLGGILFSFGKIFPGVSSTFFLIVLGIYKKILILFSNPLIIFNNFWYYFPFMLGIVIGLLIFIKLLNYLLKKKYDYLYSSLIGFMASSIIPIFPKIEFSIINFIGMILMIISFIISFKTNLKKDI